MPIWQWWKTFAQRRSSRSRLPSAVPYSNLRSSLCTSSTTIASCQRSATACVSCYTDTDSFVCHIESEDLIGELGTIADRWLDTSNFEPTHPLYSSTNFCTLGKFKSETADVPLTEFIGLRSKMYSLSTLSGNKEYHKVKVVPKSYVKKHVTHEQYLHVLRRWARTSCRFRAFRSRNHRVTTRIMSKVCLSCLDDKRYLLPDAINSLAYGHRDIDTGGGGN